MLYKTKVAELRYENDGQVTLAKIKKKKINKILVHSSLEQLWLLPGLVLKLKSK